MERVPMTPEGFAQLQEKLERLKNVEIPRLQKALGDARELGDLSENAEFETARAELWTTERIIAELEDRVGRAEILDSKRAPADSVAIGALVKVQEIGARKPEEILLVGEGETRKEYDCVSVTSPLGRAFVGKKVGEMAEVQAPRGTLRFQILELRYP
ncbi:MAG: transcription elongation factor GreA [Planctomycetes bacterium]|nr:transcription elongation factor GreA [Planctomycetota bacterium]